MKTLGEALKINSVFSAFPPRLCGKNAFSSSGVMLFYGDSAVRICLS